MKKRPTTLFSASMSASLFAIVIVTTLSACGVRGRPQPPLAPAELGRGQPSFKGATEEMAFPSVPSPDATPRPSPRPAGRSQPPGGSN
jgi:hypothetical protein